jgi:hypothetical protein
MLGVEFKLDARVKKILLRSQLLQIFVMLFLRDKISFLDPFP